MKQNQKWIIQSKISQYERVFFLVWVFNIYFFKSGQNQRIKYSLPRLRVKKIKLNHSDYLEYLKN